MFDRQLRRNVVFADHSLATGTVFSEVHLVSCRNVLIYFNRDLQDRAVGLFREAGAPRLRGPGQQGVAAVRVPRCVRGLFARASPLYRKVA